MKKPLILLTVGLLLSLLVYAASYYTVPATTAINITEFTTCRTVTNNNINAIFVPTNTTGEWTAFKSSNPTSVGITCCDGSKSCP